MFSLFFNFDYLAYKPFPVVNATKPFKMAERSILEIFENRRDWANKKINWFQPKKVAEMDITNLATDELEAILELQEILGRTWSVKRIRTQASLRMQAPE